MKKIIFLISIFAFAFIFSGCKKKKEAALPPPPPKKEIKKISEETFVTKLAEIADTKSLKPGEVYSVNIDPNKVNTKESKAKVEPFKTEWKYDELYPVLKEYPLSVYYLCKEGSHMPIWNWEDFVFSKEAGLYEPKQVFYVDPKPKYFVYLGNRRFVVGQDGKLWHTR